MSSAQMAMAKEFMEAKLGMSKAEVALAGGGSGLFDIKWLSTCKIQINFTSQITQPIQKKPA